MHKVYAVISKYADNLSITHTSKQSISLYQDLPCTSYLLEPNSHRKLTLYTGDKNVYMHEHVLAYTDLNSQHSHNGYKYYTNGSPLLNLDTVITHCYM
jgi:hypothetical protein